jgi:hypothetical protein
MLEIAPTLHLSERVPKGPGRTTAQSRDTRECLAMKQEGFAGLERVADVRVCDSLVSAVGALRSRDLPASFLYAFDEVWVLGESIRERLTHATGHDYRLVEDIWAWHILPGRRGWPPHRGAASETFDREAPAVINAWIALSDVTADRSCMHAVPLDDDPGYPDALERLDAPLAAVRALPRPAGDALFWNANVLHWGGPCSARASGPRVSCSFTLCRADAAARFPDLVLLPELERLDLTTRMDVIARMILIYGKPDGDDVTAAAYEWAKVTQALATRFVAR